MLVHCTKQNLATLFYVSDLLLELADAAALFFRRRLSRFRLRFRSSFFSMIS
jgi:hypothetical protein